MKKNNQFVVLIPALDPPVSFVKYVEKLIQNGISDIIVVDDGSRDKDIFEKIDRHPQVVVLTHEVNFGKGRGLRTGIRYYLEHFSQEEYAGIVTADSDGQHLCEDVKKLGACLGSDDGKMILGVRDFNQADVPPKSRFGNKLTSSLFRVLLGYGVTDTQTGLRAIPNNMLQMCLEIPGDRFEYETAVLIWACKEKRVEERTIHTVYLDENKGTHFHPIRDSYRIYRLLLGTFVKYLFVSLSSFLLDYLLFLLGAKLLFRGMEWRIMEATVCARILSGIYNYFMNKKVVFENDGSYVRTGLGYLLLCVVQCAVSAVSVQFFTKALLADEAIVKPVVDIILFFVNYFIQKKIIFGRHRKSEG